MLMVSLLPAFKNTELFFNPKVPATDFVVAGVTIVKSEHVYWVTKSGAVSTFSVHHVANASSLWNPSALVVTTFFVVGQ